MSILIRYDTWINIEFTYNWLLHKEKQPQPIAVEYVNLCGRKLGDNQWVCENRTPLTLDEIASQLGTNKRLFEIK